MDIAALTERPASLFVNGGFRAAAGPERLTVVDPSTAAPFAEVACADAADVEAAVAAAAAAFPSWARLSGGARAEYLRRIAAGLRARQDALVQLQMLNNGKPRGEAEIDLGDAAATFDYYAGMAEALDGRQGEPVPMPDPAFAGRTRFEPVGPVGMIVPWNFPLVTSAWKIAPALAAGCTVVLKTSEFTPLIELAYGDIAEEAGLPAGVLNLLTGAAEAGAALTRDRRLRKLSFTGSNLVGAKVMAAAAPRCLPVSLELGGKSPIVVFADAEIDHAVDCIAAGIFYNAGQMCSATSRLIVEASAVRRPCSTASPSAPARSLSVPPPPAPRWVRSPRARSTRRSRAFSTRPAPSASTASRVAKRPTAPASSCSRASSPTCLPRAFSGARRSSARCSPCAASRPRPRRSSWRTTATTASSPPW